MPESHWSLSPRLARMNAYMWNAVASPNFPHLHQLTLSSLLHDLNPLYNSVYACHKPSVQIFSDSKVVITPASMIPTLESLGLHSKNMSSMASMWHKISLIKVDEACCQHFRLLYHAIGIDTAMLLPASNFQSCVSPSLLMPFVSWCLFP